MSNRIVVPPDWDTDELHVPDKHAADTAADTGSSSVAVILVCSKLGFACTIWIDSKLGVREDIS